MITDLIGPHPNIHVAFRRVLFAPQSHPADLNVAPRILQGHEKYIPREK
jgi:hypothetical protein